MHLLLAMQQEPRRKLTVNEKVELLKAAEGSHNIAETCRLLGLSRSTYYVMKKAYLQNGEAGLHPKPRRKPRMPNAFSEEVVRRILEMTWRFPSFSCERIRQRLLATGLNVSGSGVRKVWKRYQITRKDERLIRLRRLIEQGEVVLLSRDPVR